MSQPVYNLSAQNLSSPKNRGAISLPLIKALGIGATLGVFITSLVLGHKRDNVQDERMDAQDQKMEEAATGTTQLKEKTEKAESRLKTVEDDVKELKDLKQKYEELKSQVEAFEARKAESPTESTLQVPQGHSVKLFLDENYKEGVPGEVGVSVIREEHDFNTYKYTIFIPVDKGQIKMTLFDALDPTSRTLCSGLIPQSYYNNKNHTIYDALEFVPWDWDCRSVSAWTGGLERDFIAQLAPPPVQNAAP